MSEQEMSNIETFGEFCKNNSCSNCRFKKIATITGCFDCEKHFMKEHDNQIRADAIDEFVRWAYVHGIDFSFMGKIKDDGTSDAPERLQKIKNDFWEQLKEQKNG